MKPEPVCIQGSVKQRVNKAFMNWIQQPYSRLLTKLIMIASYVIDDVKMVVKM